jgi:hypothetical protein
MKPVRYACEPVAKSIRSVKASSCEAALTPAGSLPLGLLPLFGARWQRGNACAPVDNLDRLTTLIGWLSDREENAD